MTKAPFRYHSERGPVTVWTCDSCGERFEWQDAPQPQCFCSAKTLDAEDWDAIRVVCSDKCKVKLEASG